MKNRSDFRVNRQEKSIDCRLLQGCVVLTWSSVSTLLMTEVMKLKARADVKRNL